MPEQQKAFVDWGSESDPKGILNQPKVLNFVESFPQRIGLSLSKMAMNEAISKLARGEKKKLKVVNYG